ncbi:alpha/beta hydrolase [Xanthomonas albilineans]|uniref:Putative esterase/lipase/thioesterase protein n=1 Tax=Xanthomonas albilineans (strain GPE PC73 / CFBP 7063) TaxID=380358 RepID=D2UE72_XANAP|nr:alpha/beta fold hydrolase [Xanthomonas albilineans]QHQ28503.1 putative esterase/lipase/thioesterase protein [Xanthomonas albilineans]CBA16270.1 putative esterase/lipase/thioesterase protein [Xanthomonas albilineans GPE PC73]
MTQSAEFHFEGGRHGVLLIHGLTGTPSEMRLLGKSLQRHGFSVHGVQLAGHCGDEDDLLATGWRDWYASVEQAAARMRPQVDSLFVAGLSMGALLALRLAVERPQWVDGVGVLGATFRYDGWNIPKRARLAFILPLLKRLGIGKRRIFLEEPPYGLRDERIRAQVSSAMLGGDSSAAGLPGNPWYALAELHLLSRQVRRNLAKVKAPCLVAHATDDDIAHLRNARLVIDNVSGPTELLLLHDSYHMITLDRERRTLGTRLAQFFAALAAAAPRQAA